jgi:hypothetical protein
MRPIVVAAVAIGRLCVTFCETGVPVGFWVFAKPKGVHFARVGDAKGDLSLASTAAIDAVAPDGRQHLLLGCHESDGLG